MASVLFPLSAWPVLGNSGSEYHLRGGSCIVPITAVCGHIPTIKMQKNRKSLTSAASREGWEFAACPNASCKASKVSHSLLLMSGQPGVSRVKVST